MDEVTKEMAKKKARGMVEHIGYPSGAQVLLIRDTSGTPQVQRESHLTDN